MKRLLLFVAVVQLSISSCTVYTPLQPTLPSIRNAGELEVRASVQPTLRGDASIAYSPAKHFLVSAAGGLRPQSNMPDSSLYRASLAEIGLGTYWPLGEYWTLHGLGGFGWGQADRNLSNGFIFASHANMFSRYQTQFLQVGTMLHYRRLKLGLGYRFTRVSFQELRSTNLDLPLENQLRHEPFLTARIELGRQAVRHWQLELSTALSVAQRGQSTTADNYTPTESLMNMNRAGAGLLGFGIVYWLHPGASNR